MDTFYIKLDEYYERFKKVFPATEYNLPKEKAIKLIDKCLKEGKPAEELKPLRKNVYY